MTLALLALAVTALAGVAVLRGRADVSLPLVFVLLIMQATRYAPAEGQLESLRWAGLLGCGFAIGLRALMTRKLLAGFRWPLIVFCLLSVLSALWSLDPDETIQRAVSFVLVICIAAQAGVDLKGRSFALAWAPVVALISVLGWLGLLEAASGTRAASVFANPNYFGLVSMACGLVALPELMRRRSLTWLFLTGGCMAGVVASQSRSAGVAVAVGVLVLVRSTGLVEKSGRRTAARLLLWTAVLLITVGLIELVQDRGLESSQRTVLWSDAVEIINDRPIVGFGFGTTEQATAERLSVDRYSSGSRVHNSWLDLAIQIGVVGLIALAWALWVVALSPSRRVSRFDAAARPLLIGCLVAATFESWFSSAGSAVPLIFWTGFMTLAIKETSSPPGNLEPVGAHNLEDHR